MTGEADRWLEYGSAIERLREEREMSREALAEAAGISHSYLYEIERGVKRPSTDVLAKVAAALGMRPSAILEYIESQAPRDAPGRLPSASIIASPSSRRSRTSAANARVLSFMDSPSRSERPLEMLLKVALELTDEDIKILLALARRLASSNR